MLNIDREVLGTIKETLAGYVAEVEDPARASLRTDFRWWGTAN